MSNPMSNIEHDTFICLDCETTGLNVESDRIIEVAAIKFSLNEVFDTYESLIDPECQIPESSIAIHHITEEMVRGKPVIAKVLPDLLKFIGNHIIVGHGIGFDIQMLANAASRANIAHTLSKNKSLDTLRLARLYGESPVNSLEQLRKHFNIAPEGAHRAMNDCLVNTEVFKHLVRKYKKTEEVFKALEKPILFKIMPLGKYKGRLLKDIPIDYLMWASYKDFDGDLLFSLRSEIKRRKKGGLFSQSTNPFSGL